MTTTGRQTIRSSAVSCKAESSLKPWDSATGSLVSPQVGWQPLST